MMGEQLGRQDRLFYEFCLEDRVPADHLLRRIDAVLELSWLGTALAPYYSHTGCPSVDPELMIRMPIVGYCYSIRSERRLCQEVKMNLAYRWFCRLGLEDRGPDQSTFSVYRHGRFRDSDAFRMVFESVVRRCMGAGLVGGEGMQSSWRWNDGTMFPNMDVIWEMSDEGIGMSQEPDRHRTEVPSTPLERRREHLSRPGTATACVKEGDLLTRQRGFDEATELYRRAIDLDDTYLPAYFSLSALQFSTGSVEKARHTLEQGLRVKPYMYRTCYGEPVANILELKGVQNGFFMLGGSLYRKLRGGNFTTKYLIDRNKFTKTTFYVTNDNLLTYRDMPKYDIVVNTIADPDREDGSLRTAAKFLEAIPDVPVINRPEQVIPTTRDENAARLNAIDGVVFPKTVRLSTSDRMPPDVLDELDRLGFSFPILVRETGSHTGRTFAMVNKPAELYDYLSNVDGDLLYVIQYIDGRMRGKSNLARLFKYFRKMRVFFVDGQLYPVVCHIDTVWNVHGDNRKDLMLQHKWMVAEEVSFVTDCKGYIGSDAHGILHEISGVVGLDFFGIDFTVLPDGSVLVYELNPVMRHSFKHARNFPYLRPKLEAISHAFNRMILDRLQK